MRAAVSAALGEREVLLAFIRAVDPLGGEPLDRPGEEPGVIGDLDALGISGSAIGRSVVLLVWITGSSPSTCCHSKLFLLP